VLTRKAFTILEMMIVIFLIGVVTIITIPRLAYRTPQSEWNTILYDLNNLAIFTRQEAIASQSTYRLNFKSNESKPDTLTIEHKEQDPENPSKQIFKQATSYYLNTIYQFHPTIKIKGFYLGKKNLLDATDEQMCCYVIHDGLMQDIIIHLNRIEKNITSKASLKVMPFYGKFELFPDEHIRPEE
jgi:prepilin-type N-terminal cleavage/methylation domain-containing protein